MPVTMLEKASAGEEDYTTLDAMRDGKIQLIINTPLGARRAKMGPRFATWRRAWRSR